MPAVIKIIINQQKRQTFIPRYQYTYNSEHTHGVKPKTETGGRERKGEEGESPSIQNLV